MNNTLENVKEGFLYRIIIKSPSSDSNKNYIIAYDIVSLVVYRAGSFIDFKDVNVNYVSSKLLLPSKLETWRHSITPIEESILKFSGEEIGHKDDHPEYFL